MTADDAIRTLQRIQDASFARASETTQHAFPTANRMDGERLVAFLEERSFGVLATTRSDGRPHAAPVGFALVGARIVIASTPDAARVANLRHEPHASLVVTDGDAPPSRTAILEGTARLVVPLEAPLEMRAPFRAPDGSLPGWVGILVAMTPERILSYASSP